MKIPIRIKPGGPGPAATLLVRRSGRTSLTINHRRLHPSHPNTHLQWPTQRERDEPRVVKIHPLPPPPSSANFVRGEGGKGERVTIHHATSRTLTRVALGVLLLLALNDAARAATFRYSNNRVHIENSSAIKAALPNAQSQLMDAPTKPDFSVPTCTSPMAAPCSYRVTPSAAMSTNCGTPALTP